MTAIPAIYGSLSMEAQAAYLAWMGALIEKADHVNECSECSIGQGECGLGITLYEHEQTVWAEWRTALAQDRGEDARA